MRFRHTLSETRAGLRQNLTMTLAVIMTMWVSLSLFGAGLLASQQVNLMKGKWYDKIEISIFLCAKDTRGDQCDPGQDVTQGQKDQIRRTLETNPEVAPEGVYFETKEEAYEEFQRVTGGQPDPGLAHRRPDAGVVPRQAEESRGVPGCGELGGRAQRRSEGAGFAPTAGSVLPGAERAAAVHRGRVGTAAACSALQIGNTIRLATFARRREIGIMCLVGASNFYITVPCWER